MPKPAFQSVMRVEQLVVRVDKSPMNPKIKVVQLQCGHDYYVHPSSRAPRIGTPVSCGPCKRKANEP